MALALSIPNRPLSSQGEHFREVMKRIQSLLDIQEKEFEKVCALEPGPASVAGT